MISLLFFSFDLVRIIQIMEKDFQRKQYELQSKHFQNTQRIQGLSVDNDDDYDDNGER